MGPRRSLLVAFALGLALVAGSSPRIVGDGSEYLAQALTFASFHGPAVAPAISRSLRADVVAADPRFSDWSVGRVSVASNDRGRDFIHFWFYALLATPAVWATRAVGVNPLFAFTLLNFALLGLALRIALPRLGPAVSVLLFAGPIVWWLDKAHTEIFTFALMLIAIALVRERPWWSMVAAGAAATQNPPIVVLLGLVCAFGVLTNRGVLRDRRFWAGALGGLALALLHPAYYLWRYQTLSLLLQARRPGFPSGASLLAAVVDPDIGLVANYPAFAVAVLAALVVVVRSQPRALVSVDATVACLTGLVLLIATGQATNVHHGATPSISRYALWFVPLAVPLLREADAVGRRWWRTLIWGLAAVSAIVCAFVFHPKVDQYSREPTVLASYLWTRHPSWNNPLPEVFQETLMRSEDLWVPVATAGCEKILIAGRGTWTGVWPLPCYPEPIPAGCREEGVLCYANVVDGRYQFRVAPGPRDPYKLLRQWVWPSSSEPHVQQVFNEWTWTELKLTVAETDAVAASACVDRVWAWSGSDRVLIVIVRPGAGARLTLRLPQPMAGRLIDAVTGTPLAEVRSEASANGLWDLALPADREVLLLALRTGG